MAVIVIGKQSREDPREAVAACQEARTLKSGLTFLYCRAVYFLASAILQLAAIVNINGPSCPG